MGAEQFLEISGLTKKYGSGAAAVKVLDEVNFSAGPGEFLAVYGQSGAGKSTLLRLLGCLELPSGGSYLLGGEAPALLTDRERAYLRAHRIGFLRSSGNLLPGLTLEENVALPLCYAGIPKAEQTSRVREALEAFTLYGKRGRLPQRLSLLSQQKAAAARAYAAGAELILADEPTGELNSQDTEDFLSLLQRAQSDGKTVILGTDNWETAAYAGRQISLKDGRAEEVHGRGRRSIR